MDTDRWKSILVPREVYEEIKALSKKKAEPSADNYVWSLSGTWRQHMMEATGKRDSSTKDWWKISAPSVSNPSQ